MYIYWRLSKYKNILEKLTWDKINNILKILYPKSILEMHESLYVGQYLLLICEESNQK